MCVEYGFRISPIGHKLEKGQWRHNFPTWSHRQIFLTLFCFSYKSLVTGPCFISISSLVLELWQFSFIRDWREIQKSEIPSSEFCPISGDWSKLGISNLARMFLRKCYWMLQNAKVTAFTVFELGKINTGDGGGGGKITLPPSQIRVNGCSSNDQLWNCQRSLLCFAFVMKLIGLY